MQLLTGEHSSNETASRFADTAVLSMNDQLFSSPIPPSHVGTVCASRGRCAQSKVTVWVVLSGSGKENPSYFWLWSFIFDLIFRKSALLDIFLIRIVAYRYSNQKYCSWDNIYATSPVQSHWYAWIHGSDAGPLGVHGPIFPTTMQNPTTSGVLATRQISMCPGLYWDIQGDLLSRPSPGAWC